MLQTKRFLYVGFMCHQAIEKALKAVYSKKFNEVPPYTHNLNYLLELNGFDSIIAADMKDFINEMEPLNIKTRYPSHRKKVLNILTENKSKEILKTTKSLVKWIKSML